jgi:hypothetical protein
MGTQQQFLGTPIHIRTTFGDEIQGELFCYDVLNGSNAVILREDLNNGYCNYTFAKTNIIREIKALGPAPTREPDELPYIDKALLAHREENMLRSMQRNRMQIGVGVTREAQAIFDKLKMTMPCDWSGSDILVLKTVQISKPYKADNVAQAKNAADDPPAVQRVKKVVGELHKQLDAETAKAAKRKKDAGDAIPSASAGSSPSPEGSQ